MRKYAEKAASSRQNPRTLAHATRSKPPGFRHHPITIRIAPMPITTLTEFHHWLLTEEPAGAPFILLETGEFPRLECAARIARHLNEYDDDSVGNWIAPTPEVIHAIAADPAQRRLLGLTDLPSASRSTDPHGIREVLRALARRGHIVINHPEGRRALMSEPRGFRAALGLPEADGSDFHIILDPAGFPHQCLAPILGDSFLEWLHHRDAA